MLCAIPMLVVSLAGPVCVINNKGYTVSGRALKAAPYDYGGRHPYTIPALAGRNIQGATWHDTLVLAWHTCEGNLYHMMHETLAPISHAIAKHNLQNAHVAIVGGAWPPVQPDGCHSMRYLPLYKALNVSTLYNFEGSFSVQTNHTLTKCYRQAVQVQPDTNTNWYANVLKWASGPKCADRKPRVVIIQRTQTRRILNVQQLRDVALGFTRHVQVVDLQVMSVQNQIRTITCGNPVVAAVHGAGLAWTMLLKHTGRRAAVIEWTWPSWSTYYAGRSQSTNVLAFESRLPMSHTTCPGGYVKNCCSGDCHYPTKHVDVKVDTQTWHRDLTRAFTHIHG